MSVGPAPRTAPAADQVRLLDVQALDTRLAQVAHRRRALPEHAELTELSAKVRGLRDELTRARTHASDVDREVARAEVEVEAVRSRAERTAQRLASGTGTSKDLQALTRDAEALDRRRSDLEDVELEVMERAETAAAAVAQLTAAVEEVSVAGRAATARRDAALVELDAEAAALAADRERAAARVDAALLAFYDRIREAEAGLGAAALTGGRCGACRLELTSSTLGQLRTSAPDAVVRCEECGRILVRLEGGAS